MTREQFITLVEATQKAFRRFLVALCCGDKSLADDIAQESYIKAYLSHDSLAKTENFNAWLFKIGYNTFIDHRRGVWLTEDYSHLRSMEAKDRTDSSFEYQALYEAFNNIPPHERSSILLFYMQGYSIKEIAEIEDATQDAVKQHLSRGRKHLRGLLSDD